MNNEITRRQFHKTAMISTAAFAAGASRAAASKVIRLGAPVFGAFDDPMAWAKAHRDLGYGAAYCPASFTDSSELKKAYVEAAQKANCEEAEPREICHRSLCAD